MAEVKPALTAEEWEEDENEWLRKFAGPSLIPRQALAARCLHDQPFGFTREDVDLLSELASNEMGNSEDDTLWKPTLNLASRIEALLPPEPE